MKTLPENTALILIDVQQGFDQPGWGERNNPQAEAVIAQLLEKWRYTERPIFHIQHLSVNVNSPLRPGQDGVEFKPEAQPLDDEPIITKNVNSAFIGTNLQERLDQADIDTVVIAGFTTQHCVSTTTRMAGNLGYTTYLVSDATVAFSTTSVEGKPISAETVHEVALANLNGEFATVISSDRLLSAL